MLPQAGGGLPPTGRNDQGQDQSQTSLPAQAKQNPELGAILGRMFSRGAAAADPQDREAAINLLASQGMNREQAASTIDQWDREYQQKSAQGEQRVRQVGATAVRGVAAAAWWSFAFLVLSAGAAAWGGWIGTRGLLYVRPEPPAAAI